MIILILVLCFISFITGAGIAIFIFLPLVASKAVKVIIDEIKKQTTITVDKKDFKSFQERIDELNVKPIKTAPIDEMKRNSPF